MQGKAHLLTVTALLGFLAVGSVALRTLTRLAGEDGGSVLSTPSSRIVSLGEGAFEARPSFVDATWTFHPMGGDEPEIELQRAVFAVTRDGAEGPITRYWLNHVIARCPQRGELEYRLDRQGRLSCEGCDAAFSVDGPGGVLDAVRLADRYALGR